MIPVDVIIDFRTSQHAGGFLNYAVSGKIPSLVAATTGLSDEQVSKLRSTAYHSDSLFSEYVSLGVNLLALNLFRRLQKKVLYSDRHGK